MGRDMAKAAGLRGPEALDVAVGQRIRERRRQLGMSQQALAAATGVSFQQIQKYERGANRLSFGRLSAVARALEVAVADLVDGLQEASPRQVEQVTRLLDLEGALQMLEAYGALANDEFRRLLLAHARALAGATAAQAPVGRAGSLQRSMALAAQAPRR